LGERLDNIVFAKPVHKYDSYTDFWRLVELSGFPIISVSEIDITKDQIIITAPMNGDYMEHFVGNLAQWQETGEITGGQFLRQRQSGLPRLAHLIIWNLERPSGSGSVPEYAKRSQSWIADRFCDEVWVSDPVMADETMLRFVALGSDYGLGDVSGDKKKFDFVHMSAVNPRRTHIYKNFKAENIGPNCWPPERDLVLRQSKFALNVHQDNYPFCEPLRIALFAAYGLPIISERFAPTIATEYPYGGDIAQNGYHGLADMLKGVLGDDYGQWKEMGMRLRDKLCDDMQFGKVVRQAVSETAGAGWR
jgi:hypothetical protein